MSEKSALDQTHDAFGTSCNGVETQFLVTVLNK